VWRQTASGHAEAKALQVRKTKLSGTGLVHEQSQSGGIASSHTPSNPSLAFEASGQHPGQLLCCLRPYVPSIPT
jgi:hypothetical protein